MGGGDLRSLQVESEGRAAYGLEDHMPANSAPAGSSTTWRKGNGVSSEDRGSGDRTRGGRESMVLGTGITSRGWSGNMESEMPQRGAQATHGNASSIGKGGITLDHTLSRRASLGKGRGGPQQMAYQGAAVPLTTSIRQSNRKHCRKGETH